MWPEYDHASGIRQMTDPYKAAAFVNARLMDEYVLVGGVQWCVTHYGIVDELGNPVPDGACDIYDRHDDESCRRVSLYVKAAEEIAVDDDDGDDA